MLPIGLSVPHAGLVVPAEVRDRCLLSADQLRRDGDEGAAEIYDLENAVAHYLISDVPRAIVDLNRAADDFGPDGVVKRQTIWQEAVYNQPLDEATVHTLLAKYHQPYHARLSELAAAGLQFAVDGHTMAAQAPPISPHAGAVRPEICLGNAHGSSFPAAWTTILLEALRRHFAEFRVTLNDPFAGGFITRQHGREMPWVQLEVSRSSFLPRSEIRDRLRAALTDTCQRL